MIKKLLMLAIFAIVGIDTVFAAAPTSKQTAAHTGTMQSFEYRLKANTAIGVSAVLSVVDGKICYIYKRADTKKVVSADAVENIPPIYLRSMRERLRNSVLNPVVLAKSGCALLGSCASYAASCAWGERSNVLTKTAVALWTLYTAKALYDCCANNGDPQYLAFVCCAAARQLQWTIPAWTTLAALSAVGRRLMHARGPVVVSVPANNGNDAARVVDLPHRGDVSSYAADVDNLVGRYQADQAKKFSALNARLSAMFVDAAIAAGDFPEEVPEYVMLPLVRTNGFLDCRLAGDAAVAGEEKED